MAEIATWICWGVVGLTWIMGAAYGARGGRGRSQDSLGGVLWRLVPVVAAVIAFRLARHGLHRLTDHSGWIEVPGLALLVASTAFTIGARLTLGRMWSASPNVLKAHHELRTDGPYAITRHPIYTGLLGMTLGTVFLNGLGDSLAFLLVAAAFLGTRIPIEERLMGKTFPDEYAAYRKRVPRLVPGMKRFRRS